MHSCSVLSGLLGVVAMLCGILLVMYLGVRCRRQAGRILGKSWTTMDDAPGLPAGLVVLLNAFLGLEFVPSVHHPAPLFCRQVTCKEDGECWDVLATLLILKARLSQDPRRQQRHCSVEPEEQSHPKRTAEKISSSNPSCVPCSPWLTVLSLLGSQFHP